MVFLLIALFTETKLEGLLFGFAGAGIASGIVMIYKYFYWSSPKNQVRYDELLESEKIEQNDELKEKIRDKAGRQVYKLGILIISVYMLVFSVLESLGIIENGNMIVMIVFYLAGYLAVQIIAGIMFFKHILRKYK